MNAMSKHLDRFAHAKEGEKSSNPIDVPSMRPTKAYVLADIAPAHNGPIIVAEETMVRRKPCPKPYSS